jgi:dienelactone hydrolase
MKLFAVSAICLCLLALSHTVALAQDDLQESKGAFVTFVSGREVGRESYTFAPQPDGNLRSEAETAPAGTDYRQKIVTVATRARPLSLTAEVGGARVFSAEFGDGTAKLRTAGQPDRDVATRASVVLENLLWHQFHFLFAQYDRARGGKQDFTIFLPSAARDFDVAVERLDSPAYDLKRGRVETEHYRMTVSTGLVIESWVGAGRVPLLFYAGAQQLKGVRVGYEELEQVVLGAATKAAEYKPPPYAAPSAFTEKEVTVGAGTEWALPGTLSMPVGKAPFPAVVLVHGSGPNDRDESLLASKPFRDLAWGLASQGVAVLRYDKRTKVHPAKTVKIKRFTPKDEAIDDALAALALLRETPGVDAKRVFVLGHSLGATLAPRLGAADAKIRGLVIMAGLTHTLEDTTVRQYEYLLSLDGKIDPDEQKLIERVKRDRDRVKQLTAADIDSTEMLQGIPASYWLDLRGYDPVALAGRLKMPLLVLLGERDYNVTMEDFRDWQKLSGSKLVTLKSYAKLDHHFEEGEGKSSDADYAVPRNIPRYVIDDIVAFIKSH